MTKSEKEVQLGARYGRFVIRWRWPVLLITLIAGLGVASGARFLGFNQDYRAFFSEENPELVAYEKLQRTYSKSDTIIFAVLPRDGKSPFERPVVEAVSRLTEGGWLLPNALRVDSMTNFQHTVAEGDDLIVSDLVEDVAALTPHDLERIRSVALSEPSLVGQLVNDAGQSAGVLVTFLLPGESIDEMPNAARAAQDLAAEIEAEYPVDVKLTGSVMINYAFFQSGAKDFSTLMPLMYLMIIVATFLMVRSLSATIGSVIVLLMSAATGLGAAGWLGILLTPPSAMAPIIITTLAIADSIHFLMTMKASMRKGIEKQAAIIESLRVNLQPIALTSLTTAVGFLSLNFSDAPPFHDLGNITAIGVVAAFVYSAVFLPALLAILPMRVRVVERSRRDPFDRLADWVIAKRRPVLAASLAVSCVFLAFLPLNEFNDHLVEYFDQSMVFRQHTDLITERLTGLYRIDFSLDTGEDNGVSDPEFLRQADAFTAWLREQPEVLHVQSITDTFKRLNRSLHGDDESWYRLPEEREQAAQYLLLYELSLPYGLDLNNQLDIRKSATRVTATTYDMDSDEVINFSRRAENWLHAETPLDAVGTGASVMFSHIGERNINSMIRGTLVALVIISLIIIAALRSFRIGLISLLPNLLPLGITFGIWAVWVGEVNVAASIVMSMAMGIVVDDSVHFLSKYLRARREHGYSAEDSVRYAFHHVGTALLVTSVILVAGFSLLSLSTFALNEFMAQLTAIAIVTALAADLLLLPTLLLALDGKRTKTQETVSLPATAAQQV